MEAAIEIKQQVTALYKESKDLLEEVDKLFKDVEKTRREIERLKNYRRQKNGRRKRY